MQLLKRFFSTSIIFFIGNVSSKLVSFLLLPLYTIYITPGQFGQYDLVIAFINLVAPVAFIQIWDGVFRFSFDVSDINKKYEVINNGLIIFALGIVIYLFLFITLCCFYSFEYRVEALIYGLLFALQYYATFSARVFLKNHLFVVSGITNTIIASVSNIILIVWLNWDIKSLYVSASLGCITQILIIIVRLNIIPHISLSSFNMSLCKSMLKFSAPLCIATISYWLLSGYTKLNITYSLGAYDNGLYAVAVRFATVITLFVNVFQFAWNEIAYLIANDSGRNNIYGKGIEFLFKTMIFGSALACLIIRIIFPFFIGENYNGAYQLIPITIIGVAFNTIAAFIGTFFMMEKNTKPILTTTLVAALFNCLCCPIGISIYGLKGAIFTLSLSFFILMILRSVILRIKFNVRLNLSIISYLLLFSLVFVSYKFCSQSLDFILIAVLVLGYLYSVRHYVLMLKKR